MRVSPLWQSLMPTQSAFYSISECSKRLIQEGERLLKNVDELFEKQARRPTESPSAAAEPTPAPSELALDVARRVSYHVLKSLTSQFIIISNELYIASDHD